MGEINQSSKKIADIITHTIDEIAFQTICWHLRCCRSRSSRRTGRGFAVVASEVLNLHNAVLALRKRSKHSSKIRAQGRSGNRFVNRSGSTLGEIVNSVKRVTDIVAEIAAASRNSYRQSSKSIERYRRWTESLSPMRLRPKRCLAPPIRCCHTPCNWPTWSDASIAERRSRCTHRTGAS